MLNLTIEFDGADELEFVKRMSNVETFKDVEVLAADLAEYCKTNQKLNLLTTTILSSATATLLMQTTATVTKRESATVTNLDDEV